MLVLLIAGYRLASGFNCRQPGIKRFNSAANVVNVFSRATGAGLFSPEELFGPEAVEFQQRLTDLFE